MQASTLVDFSDPDYNASRGALAFLPLLLVLFLPWVTLTAGCDGERGLTGIELATGTVVSVTYTVEPSFEPPTTKQVRFHVPAQPLVRLMPAFVAIGVALYSVRGWPGRLARSGVAFAGAVSAALSISAFRYTVENGEEIAGDNPAAESVIVMGAFVLVGLFNLTLPVDSPAGNGWIKAAYVAGLHVPALVGGFLLMAIAAAD